MEPDTIAKIKTWDKAVTEETAKKLFIRSEAMRAYKEDRVESYSQEIIREIWSSLSVSAMCKSEIGLHIAQLEKARILLATLTQGYEIAYAEEKEPEFKAKHERESRETKIKKLSGLEALGISKEDFMNALSKLQSSTLNSSPAPEKSILILKIPCEKCGKPILPTMKSFHKC